MPTNFPHGVSSMGALVGPTAIPLGGTHFWVKPYSGSNANDGLTPDTAVKTLAQALAYATADKNDVVHLVAESNTAAYTTDYQSATLDWNKDMVHLVGECSPSLMSHRARVALISTYVTAAHLFTLSADGCLIRNLQFYAGVADTHPTGCVQITGDRNVLQRCHIAGIGHASMDIAGAYSLYLNGVEELFVEDCRIGLNTVDAGSAANSEILMASTVKNVLFRDCLIYRRIEHATNHPLVKIAAATSLDELVMFDRCSFISTATNQAYSNASPFKFVATPTQGYIFVKDSFLYNGPTAGKWDVDDLDKIIVLGHPTPAADTCSIGRLV